MIVPMIPPSTPRILAVQALSGQKVARYRVAEYLVRITGSYADPFDPAEVALDALVVAPSGRRLSIPGFSYRPYRRTTGRATQPIPISSTDALAAGKASPTRTEDESEIMVPTGPSEWRVRYAPMETGVHRLEFVLRTRAGVARRAGTKLIVSMAKGGFVRVSPRDSRFFALDDGSTYWPLGANVAWAGARGTRDYDDWLPKYGKVGANWGRLWLSPHWATFGLETEALGKMDQGNSWRLDYVLGLAQRQGIRLALCIDSYNVLRDRVSWPEWERSPHRLMLKQPTDFWTDPQVARLYRNKLRYLVARWGASTGTMAWEFWNEVDGVSDYGPNVTAIRDWHQRMAKYLRSIDPYLHPITTSFGGNGEGAGDRAIFALKGFDYTQSHRYDDPDLALGVVRAQERLGTLVKPHFLGEVGADAAGSRAEDDPTGLQIHDPLWASLATGSGGAAMPWWWDSYIAPKNLYGLFGAVARFAKGIAFDREGFRPGNPRLAYAQAPSPLPRRDAVPQADGVGWTPAPFHRPLTVRVDRDGMTAPRLAKLQQGKGNHGDLHNPVTFEIDLPWATELVIEVGDVSGYGGAALKVVRDGETVIDKPFADPDGDQDTSTLKGFAGDYRVPIPAGRHTITVENPGQDWFAAGYRLVGALEDAAPPLIAQAVIGRHTAIAWVRHADLVWRSVVAGKRPTPSPASVLTLSGLTPGRWIVQRWDTWQGRVVATSNFLVPKDGRARLPLPEIQSDVALKLVKP